MKNWIGSHPDLWEFIKFNVLSNIATVTNFILLWLGTGFLFKTFSEQSFNWFIFNYSVENGGLTGFLSFLLAYVGAQIVNYIVQRNLVFGANNSISSTLHWYILTVVFAGVVSIILPPYTISLFTGFGFSIGVAQTIANVVNIFLQVVINYPMLKFVIMKK
ncbi:hypothetical protein ACTQ5J_09775 [Fundicoccus sp. Sow4_F4]|uniref:hypothetical protein n=1 Tax=Fundicoccus sp. Sow4_F4 TaxID=3438783 RepID=UPI003F91CF6B